MEARFIGEDITGHTGKERNSDEPFPLKFPNQLTLA